MKALNHFLPVALVLIMLAQAKAQTSFTFTYDASGNRLMRVINLTKSSLRAVNDTLEQESKFVEDQVDFHRFRIYPNPTKGLLRIEMPGLIKQEATIRVYSAQGSLVHVEKMGSLDTQIDLSDYPPSFYLLQISIGQRSSEWKIIKD